MVKDEGKDLSSAILKTMKNFQSSYENCEVIDWAPSPDKAYMKKSQLEGTHELPPTLSEPSTVLFCTSMKNINFKAGSRRKEDGEVVKMSLLASCGSRLEQWSWQAESLLWELVEVCSMRGRAPTTRDFSNLFTEGATYQNDFKSRKPSQRVDSVKWNDVKINWKLRRKKKYRNTSKSLKDILCLVESMQDSSIPVVSTMD